MKNIANKIAAFAVTAVVLGAAAFGQTQKVVMKAEIPFAFHTARGTMPAGNYVVTENYSGIQRMFALRNTDSNKTLLVSGVGLNYNSADATTMSFRCDDGCELVKIQTTSNAVEFPQHRASHAWEAAVVAIHLTPANAK